MDIDSDYFTSYGDLGIHKLMLEDVPRNEAYAKAILGNSSFFKDKIVMDVGCGTGILSVFCAQAGAKKVYAIEASNLANLAKDIVKENHFEHIIEIFHCRVEDLNLPSTIKVDAIVSEWMGFYLLHEGMLDSVLIARDKFLKEGGQIFPEKAGIYVAPCSLPSLYNKWGNISGVSMMSFAKHLRAEKCNKPEILSIQPEDLLANEEPICWINLKEDKISDLDSFCLQHVVGANKSGAYQGLCIWFDCIFPNFRNGDEDETILTTSPKSPVTHWKQTVIVLPQEIQVDDGEPIAFKLEIKRDSDYSRRYNLQVTMLDPANVDHPVPCSCHMTKCIIIKTFMMQNNMTNNIYNSAEDDSITEEEDD